MTMTDETLDETLVPEDGPDDTLKCAVCGHNHDRYYRVDGTTPTWQIVKLSARSEDLAVISVEAEVCRDKDCSVKWFESNVAALLAQYRKDWTAKRRAERINAKLDAGAKRAAEDRAREKAETER